MTKKITDEQRITVAETSDKVSRKTGRTRKRPVRPRTSLTDKLSNLHLLLRVLGFARWPLQVRFFCEDVYQKWQRWDKAVDGTLRSGTKIILDVKQGVETLEEGETPVGIQAKAKRKQDALGKGGVDGLDVGYEALKSHVEKGILLLAEDEASRCAVCSKDIGVERRMALVCPREGCRTAFHMSCLATKFLEDDSLGNPIVPTSGRCPECKAELQWVDLVKEMSLRARGEKEVVQLMKKPRERNAKVLKISKAAAAAATSQAEVNDGEDINDTDAKEDIDRNVAFVADVEDDPLPDDWHFQVNDDDDDMMSVTSATSDFWDSMDTASPSKVPVAAPRLKAVIEDSEWDDADVLD